MQKAEFNHMMEGKPAKWADVSKMEDKRVLLPGNVNTAARRALIQKHEESIPEPTMEDIQAVIKKLRDSGMKESKVRRIVKNTFRITVV